jgi:hypothetical protein
MIELLTPDGPAGVAVLRMPLGVAEDLGLSPEVLRGECSTAALVVGGLAVDRCVVVQSAAGLVEVHVHGAVNLIRRLLEGWDVGGACRPSTRLSPTTACCDDALLLALEQARYDAAAEKGLMLSGAQANDSFVWGRFFRRSRAAIAQWEAMPLVLLGAQNAGKSTLFSSMVGRLRSLASPIKGTTRDSIVADVHIGGFPYRVVDTPGHIARDAAADSLDLSAVRCSRRHRSRGLRLLLIDGQAGPSSADYLLANAAHLVLVTKVAHLPDTWPRDLRADLALDSIAAGSTAVRDLLDVVLRRIRGLPSPGPVGGFAVTSSVELRQMLRLRRVASGSNTCAVRSCTDP